MAADPVREAVDFSGLAERSAPVRTALIAVDKRTMTGVTEIDDVIQRLREAADTLRRLGMRGLRPAAMKAGWPDVARSAWEAFNAEAPEKTRVIRSAPSPALISRMDEAIRWLLWIERGTAVIVWAKASGVKWRTLEHRLGLSESTLRNRRREAIVTIAAERVRHGKKCLAVIPGI